MNCEHWLSISAVQKQVVFVPQQSTGSPSCLHTTTLTSIVPQSSRQSQVLVEEESQQGLESDLQEINRNIFDFQIFSAFRGNIDYW